MATKNHALDDRILSAAKTEFLENGYEAASLRKIAAQAGVTIGAIYTRYKTKDALFCALVQPLLDRIAAAYPEIRSSYQAEQQAFQPEQFAFAMKTESDLILHLLFDDYDRAVLFLCKSGGSSLAHFFDRIVERKVQETYQFFRALPFPHPSEQVLKLLITSQFQMYGQILREGCDLAEARQLMSAAMTYHAGGWMALLQNQESEWR